MKRDELVLKIQQHKAVVGVIGLGYVGLPLLLRFGQVGFQVVGFDIDLIKVKELNAGRSYIGHIESKQIKALRKANGFEATTNFKRLSEADCIVACVPTPLNSKKEPELKYIEKTAESIAETFRPGQLVVLESTTYPGTTEEVLLERFNRVGLEVGNDYFLSYSPEREDPGNQNFSTQTFTIAL